MCADAQFLAPADRALLCWVYGEGRPTAHIAAMVRRDARVVGRRLKRLVRRCDSREFAFVLAHASLWEAPLAGVARACVLEGLSIRAAADKLGIATHEVRRHRGAVLAMARGARIGGR